MIFFNAFLFICTLISALFVNADVLDTGKLMAKIYKRLPNGEIDMTSQMCLDFISYHGHQIATLVNATTFKSPCMIQLDVDIVDSDFDLSLLDYYRSPVTKVYLDTASIDGEVVLVRKESSENKFSLNDGLIYSGNKYFNVFQYSSGFSRLQAYPKGSVKPAYAIVLKPKEKL